MRLVKGIISQERTESSKQSLEVASAVKYAEYQKIIRIFRVENQVFRKTWNRNSSDAA